MENRVDRSKLPVINERVFRRCPYFRTDKFNFYKDRRLKDDASCYYLDKMIPEKDEDIFARISDVWAEVSNLPEIPDFRITDGDRRMYIHQCVWARMCAVAYFFYHDDPLWRSVVFAKLEEKCSDPTMALEIRLAKLVIDDYYEEQKALNPSKKEKAEETIKMGKASEIKQDTPKIQDGETVKCRYIDLEGLAKTGIYSEAEYTKELRHACEQDARALCAFLKKGVKVGYLDFHGDKMTQIYRHLKECFPGTMNYSYTNFNIYYNKNI